MLRLEMGSLLFTFYFLPFFFFFAFWYLTYFDLVMFLWGISWMLVYGFLFLVFGIWRLFVLVFTFPLCF